MTGIYHITSVRWSLRKEYRSAQTVPDYRAGHARTFQNIRLFANMTALENVLVGEHVRLHSNLIGQIIHDPGR